MEFKEESAYLEAIEACRKYALLQSNAVNAWIDSGTRLGLNMLKDPPTVIPAIPSVQYHNIIVTPGLIQFSRLQNPSAGYRLSVRISSAANKGRKYLRNRGYGKKTTTASQSVILIILATFKNRWVKQDSDK